MEKVLIIDEHPITCISYKHTLEKAIKNRQLPKLQIDTAKDVKTALAKIKIAKARKSNYSVAFLDPQVTKLENGKTYDGTDIGLILKRANPHVHLIIQTGWACNYFLYQFFKNLDPDGIVLKEDLKENDMVLVMRSVLSNGTYYSHSFSRLIRSQFSKGYDFQQHDRDLLYYLSIGVNMNMLPNYIPLSLSTVERRRKIIAKKLGLETFDAKSLIKAAKKAYLI